MPARKDLGKLLIIGSGPIVIGQAAEFDYSGTQAVRSLREEGYYVVLVNSNPATIMTEPGVADRTYIEPLTVESITAILERERVDGILSGMGGQTALNLCAELHDAGILERLGVELLGTGIHGIRYGEDRELFRGMMDRIGEPVPKSFAVGTVEEARRAAQALGGYPVIVRPAFTLGGSGSGVARNQEDLEQISAHGLRLSRVRQVLIEECVLNWKEFEYEVMRDAGDTTVIVCNMENLDPMGIHTGESIVVAPAQTLSDVDHQMLRNAALKIIRALKIEGGCNVQFALNPKTSEYRVIEVNPRVSRSSALASKATGYPIARVAAKIAVGYRLHEIPNSATKKTTAAFEPSLDYVVTKIPRWPFDKFPHAERRLGTEMKSTGEVMAIGRSFEESLLKAIRSLEQGGLEGFTLRLPEERVMRTLSEATDERLWCIAEAFRLGHGIAEIAGLTGWDRFFLEKVRRLVRTQDSLTPTASDERLAEAAAAGFSVGLIARATGRSRKEVRSLLDARGQAISYRMVDSCAGEFEASTPYFYSTRGEKCEVEDILRDSPTATSGSGRPRKVLIVGSGPIRIGQGIEFDCCCVQGVQAIREAGGIGLMVNCNPETVSTDFDVSDRLYFEPLTLEDVLAVIKKERPDGVILQFGGQTPLNLAVPLEKAIREEGLATRVLGTPVEGLNVAEDRKLFNALLQEIGLKQPKGGTAFSVGDARVLAHDIGYPVVVRPSYVIGGRGMEIVYSDEELERYVTNATLISDEHPILIDDYLENAIEVDVDACSDGRNTWIGGVLEHVEEAGVHSGDASMVLPPQELSPRVIAEIEEETRIIARALRVVGLLNVQFAVQKKAGKEEVYVLEANPRASRTVPFISKALGVSLAKLATRLMLGERLEEFSLPSYKDMGFVAVKSSVFPFGKIRGIDTILGPEMKSTGEVMGLARTFGEAFYKAQVAAYNNIDPGERKVYVTVRDEDKEEVGGLCARLSALGTRFVATQGTAQFLRSKGVECEVAFRVSENRQPDALGLMRTGEVGLIVNTPSSSSGAKRDGYMMRRLAIELGIPYITTVRGFRAAIEAILTTRSAAPKVMALDEYLSLSTTGAEQATVRSPSHR